MANYIATCRSNKFQVKDAAAFKEAMAKLPDVQVVQDVRSDIPLFCLLGNNPDGAGWPSDVYEDENDDWTDVDVPQAVAPHLCDGEVAVFVEVGAEKLRYVIGYAVAINNKGDERRVGLDDIYDLAKGLLPTDSSYVIPRAEY